ncbi:hypothetical protein B0T24DRAFT_671523 [Lasiosphaeria ovina]|uniref:AA1-like domain-containing protein n=1 Tax=Lasiosphaeria ovina TaxID=92902 RepID=A0AAE0MZE1_9PEZI|nr:hypothetical protein B0T24DRAFT_671523 [Lasiosphaeria ovina]
MMTPISTPFLLLLPLLSLSSATPTPASSALASRTPLTASSAAACPIPSWTVRNLTVTYSAETYTPGAAWMTLAENNSTGAAVGEEALSCEVSFNYRASIEGTPAHPNLNVLVFFSIDTAFVTINQTWVCPTNDAELGNPPGTSSFVIGLAEVSLACPEPPEDGMTCASKDAVAANGVVQVMYPEAPETKS